MAHKVYTLDTVKDLLPDVKVKVSKTKIETGKVRGRRNPFAAVYVGYDCYEFAWQTIVNALNNDRPLLID